MKISKSGQTPALGAGIFASVAAGKNSGGYDSIDEAQKVMTGIGKVYVPNPKNHQVYKKIYKLYKQLHDAFGTNQWSGKMHNVMKELLSIKSGVLNK
jgi:L-ribulokinase